MKQKTLDLIRSSVVLLICMCSFILWRPGAHAATYYVDAAMGSDSNNGLAWGSAFKSIAKATDRYGSLTAGDTILVKPGTYSGFELTKAGTSTNRITLSREGSGEAIIDSSVQVTGWTQSSGQIYYASLAAGPEAVVVDRSPLLPELSLGAMTEGKFYYDSSTKRLYLWAPGGGSPASHAVGIVADNEYNWGALLSGASNVTIDGLTFRYASGNGIEIVGDNVILRNSKVEFNGKAGISVYGYGGVSSDNVLIENNEIYHNMLRNWPRGKEVHGYKWCCWAMGVVSHGTTNFKAIGNIVHKNGGEGIGGYMGNGTIFRNNISYDNWSVNLYLDNTINGIVEKNTSYCTTPNTGNLYNNGDPDPSDNRNARRLRPEGIMLGNEDYGSGFNLRNVQVTNNLVSNCRRGITYYGEGGGLQDVLIANNSVVVAAENEVGGGWLTGISIPAYGTNSNVVVKNNIIYSTNPTNIVIETWPNNQTTFNNNLYYSTTNSSPFRYNDAVVSFTTWKSSIGNQDAASINQNPQFVSTDPINGNFLKLNSSSSAINTGATLAQVTTDFSGVTRPIGPAYDIGAYEYGTSTPDTTPPTLPSNFNLAANATSQSSINVSWNPATDDVGIDHYIVERCTGLSCTTFTQVGTLTASPFIDSGLTASTGYSYHVRAVDAAGNMSGWSNVVGATTQAPPAPDTQAPTTPSNLSATAVSSSTINLTWTASTDNVAVTNYQVERCSGSSCTTFTQAATSTTNSYSDTGLTASTTYRYQVRASDAAGNNSSYSSIASATTQDVSSLSDSLMLGLNFNEGSGTTTQDVSGHSNTGTLNSGATWNTTGKNGNSVTFNGTSGYITVNDNNTLDLTTAMTLSAWVYPTRSSSWQTVMMKELDAIYYLYAGGNGTNIPTAGINIGGYKEISSTTSIPTNAWTYLAATWDGTTERLYVNGTQMASLDVSGTLQNTSDPLRIGGNTHWGEYFQGRIDDLRIYNTALTQSEIQTDMNTPLTQPSTFSSCSTVTPTNFTDPTYTGYGAPYDVFASNTPLISTQCSSTDTHTLTATLGIPGDTTRIVYTKGYYYDPGINDWTSFTGTCTGALNGEWCQGSVSASVTNANISTASVSDPSYLVGFTCRSQNGSWKCGCRDTSCSNFYWQVQGAGM